MLDSFVFHHIGVAVQDIEATSKLYVEGGYHKSKTVYDPIQRVNICWLTRNGAPTIELLAPVDKTSPVCTILEKNGVTPYHFCYEVNDIDVAARLLRNQRYVMVSNPEKAVAFCGSKVAFFYNRSVGLVELVESPIQLVD